MGGYSIGRQIKQDQAVDFVMQAKPEQSQGYTADDGRNLEALANAKDAQGNALYAIGADALPTYGCTNRSEILTARREPERMGEAEGVEVCAGVAECDVSAKSAIEYVIAIAIPAQAHAGQLDKGGQPHILHPLRVMLRVADRAENPDLSCIPEPTAKGGQRLTEYVPGARNFAAADVDRFGRRRRGAQAGTTFSD